jgi:hypothetical protein
MGIFLPMGGVLGARKMPIIPHVWGATAIKLRTTPKLIHNRFSQNTMKFAVEFLFHWVYTYILTINLAKKHRTIQKISLGNKSSGVFRIDYGTFRSNSDHSITIMCFRIAK